MQDDSKTSARVVKAKIEKTTLGQVGRERLQRFLLFFFWGGTRLVFAKTCSQDLVAVSAPVFIACRKVASVSVISGQELEGRFADVSRCRHADFPCPSARPSFVPHSVKFGTPTGDLVTKYFASPRYSCWIVARFCRF